MKTSSLARLVTGVLLLAALPALSPAAERASGLRQSIEPAAPPRGAPSDSIKPRTGDPVKAPPAGGEMRMPGMIDRPIIERAPATAAIRHRGTRYLVTEGRWFEQRGDALVETTPPAGVLVEDLPEGYSVRWVDGVPYFQAAGLYLVWRERQRRYEVLQAPPAADQPGVDEPRNGSRASPARP